MTTWVPRYVLALTFILSAVHPAAALVNVNPTTGYLPTRGDNYASIQSGLEFVPAVAKCPPGAFISSWSIGISPRNFSTAQGSVQTLMVTGLAGTCSNASGPPYNFVNRLWGYGTASAGVQNVSVASPLEGQTVVGSSLERTSTVVGGILSFMGVGSPLSNFTSKVTWQDSCPQGSYVNGYLLFTWLPPGSNDSAAVTVLSLSCSGFQSNVSFSPLVTPRAHYPPFRQFLPLVGNTSAATPANDVNEAWLPWQGASTFLLSKFAGLLGSLQPRNTFRVNTKVCPLGSYLSRVQVAVAFARVAAFNASCAEALTGVPVVQFSLWGDPTITGTVIEVAAKNATAVDVGTSLTSAGPVLASLFGVGAAAPGVNTSQMTCPQGQVLDGYELIQDFLDSGILAIRFHCSVIAGLETAPLPGGTSLFPATLESSNSSASESEARIVDLINARRQKAGVANMTSRAPEHCAALAISARFGNTAAPNCSYADLSQRTLTGAYLDSIYAGCLGPGVSSGEHSLITITCQDFEPMTPDAILNDWFVDNRSFKIYEQIRNASYINAGVSRVGYLTTGWFSTADSTQGGA